MAVQPSAAGAGPGGSPELPRPAGSGIGPLLAFVALGGLLAAVAVVPPGAPYAIAFLAPAALAGVVAVAARPDLAVVGMFALTGFQGTLIEYTPIPGNGLVDFVLVALWLALAWRVLNFPHPPVWLMPGVLALGVYIVISFISAFFANPVSDGFDSIHLSVWLMASVLLIGLGPWTSDVLWTIAKGALVIGAAVGAYALLRTITGPTDAEKELALRGKPGFLQLKTSGSTPSAGHLASWCAAMLPLALAMTMTLRGRWQYLAGLTAALSLFSLLATEIRTGIVAGIAACLLVFALFAASRSFSTNTKSLRLAAAGVLAFVIIVVSFASTIGGSNESAERFERILNPTTDYAYESRIVRWREAVNVMEDNPFGLGLGTLGSVAANKPFLPDLTKQIDSSYIKVGVEQGPVVLVFFALALLLLLANLSWRSVTSPSREQAALGIAGAGALLGLIISFYANTFIEEPQVLTGWLIVGLGVAQFSRARAPADSNFGEKPAPLA